MRPSKNTNDKINDFKGTIVRLVTTLKKYRIGIVIVIIFSIISAIFSVVSPKILGKIMTEIATGVVSRFQTGVGINYFDSNLFGKCNIYLFAKFYYGLYF